MAQDGAKVAPRGLQEVSCRLLPSSVTPFLGPSWAHLRLSWALLAPFRGVQEGILRQIWCLEGLILGCKKAKSQDIKNIKKPLKSQRFWQISGGNKPSKNLQSSGLEVLYWACMLEESNLDVTLASR